MVSYFNLNRCDCYSFGIILYEIFSRGKKKIFIKYVIYFLFKKKKKKLKIKILEFPFSEFEKYSSSKEIQESIQRCLVCGDSECKSIETCQYETKTVVKNIKVWNNNGIDIKEAISQKNLRPTFPSEAPEEIKQLAIKCYDNLPDNRPSASLMVERLSFLLGVKDEKQSSKKQNNLSNLNNCAFDKISESSFFLFSSPYCNDYNFLAKQLKVFSINKSELLFLNGGTKLDVFDTIQKRKLENRKEIIFGCDTIEKVGDEFWTSSVNDSFVRVWKYHKKKNLDCSKKLDNGEKVLHLFNFYEEQKKTITGKKTISRVFLFIFYFSFLFLLFLSFLF